VRSRFFGAARLTAFFFFFALTGFLTVFFAFCFFRSFGLFRFCRGALGFLWCAFSRFLVFGFLFGFLRLAGHIPTPLIGDADLRVFVFAGGIHERFLACASIDIDRHSARALNAGIWHPASVARILRRLRESTGAELNWRGFTHFNAGKECPSDNA